MGRTAKAQARGKAAGKTAGKAKSAGAAKAEAKPRRTPSPRARARARARRAALAPVEGASITPLSEETPASSLPAGRRVELARGGSLFVREVAGPPDAPVLLLLHGFVASGGLNWQCAFEPLGQHFRVIAPDLRGHGRGPRSLDTSFTFADCADDLAALLEALEIEAAITVGYSMGGPIAQTLWQRHPERVAGLVLCATAPITSHGGRLGAKLGPPALAAVAATARLGQLATRIPNAMMRQLRELVAADSELPHMRWALGEMAGHDLRMLVEAAAELQRFDAVEWSRSIDVPAACVITTQDETIPPESQILNALHIRNATLYCVEVGHVAHANPEFLTALVTACRDVGTRASTATPPRRRARIRHGVSALVDSVLA